MTDEELGRTIDEAGSLPKDAIDPMTGQTFGAGNVPAMHVAMGAAARRLVIAELLAGAGVDKDALQAAMARAYDGSGCGQCSIGGIHAAYWAVAPVLARLVAERDEWKRRFELAKSDLIDCGEWRED